MGVGDAAILQVHDDFLTNLQSTRTISTSEWALGARDATTIEHTPIMRSACIAADAASSIIEGSTNACPRSEAAAGVETIGYC